MKRRRLDEELICQGICSDRAEALRLVMAGAVSMAGSRFSSPATPVEPGAPIHVRSSRRFVGRGGLKLAGALDVLGISPRNLDCVDIGASTGGFTDCLLKRGAAHVLSIDVGRAQFDWSLRGDERVTLLENTNVIDAPGCGYRASFDLAVADVSFTSIRRIIDAAIELLRDDGRFLALVKPQFEAARDEVGPGGVVRDPAVHRRVLDEVAALFSDRGLLPVGACASPITGAKGNREFFLLGNRGMLDTADPAALTRRLGAIHDAIGEI